MTRKPSNNLTQRQKGGQSKPQGQDQGQDTSGGGSGGGAADLFAWADKHPSERKIRAQNSSAQKSKAAPAKPNQAGRRNPSAQGVNIDLARAKQARSSAESHGQANRSYRAKGLGALVPKLTRKAIGQQASLDADLQIYWKDIVGDAFAASTFPRRSRFDHHMRRINGVLELTVERGYGAYMTHAKGQLLEKLNAYLGLGTFRDVKFKEGPLPQRSQAQGAGRNQQNASRRNAMPMPHIDLNDPGTRARLGLGDVQQRGGGAANSHGQAGSRPSSLWAPPPPKRHRLNLTMEDRGGTGVEHKPLAQALTYLGASLANHDE